MGSLSINPDENGALIQPTPYGPAVPYIWPGSAQDKRTCRCRIAEVNHMYD